MTYFKEIDGKQVFSTCETILVGDRYVSNPSEEMILQEGWQPYSPVINEPTEQERQLAEYQDMLAASDMKMQILMEEFLANNATGEVADLARERVAIRASIDSLGKIVQTEGDGSAFNPFKTWTPGTSVRSGEWWETFDGFIWEAIKDGIPATSTDADYWDVIGL